MSEGRYIVDINGEKKEVLLVPHGERWEITVDGSTRLVERTVVEKDEIFSIMVEGKSYLVDLIDKDWDSGQVTIGALAGQATVTVRDELEAIADEVAAATGKDGLFELKAPMPGIVVRALVDSGAAVERGQGLVILEAMKMQNELASDMEGLVQEILVEPGQMVDTGDLLARVIAVAE